jgi:hypothetical protein
MLDEIECMVSRVEPQRALVSLARQIAHVNSAEVETLALVRSTCFAAELQRSAMLELRGVMRLPTRVTTIAGIVDDGCQGVGLRLGLRAVLGGLDRRVDSAGADLLDLLERACALELLLAWLHPWLPPGTPTPDSKLELHALSLALSAEDQARLHGRVASIWRCFHQLHALGIDAVHGDENVMGIDQLRILRLLSEPRARAVSPPPTPALPRLDIEPDAPIPRAYDETSSLDL